jgi:aminoglycoside phosphotransferase (APT) family kinase protein
LEPQLAVEIIGTQFPDLHPVTAAFLGEGYDSTAFDVNDRWVFRFPKRTDVERQLFTERAVLPFLAERTSVPVPSFSFHGVPSAHFPLHFAGYEKLAGVPAIGVESAAASPGRLAQVLGEFLSSLHTFPVETAAALDVPAYPATLLLEAVREETLSDLHRVREVLPDAPEADWRRFFERPPDGAGVTPVLVHGDLAAEHILVDPGTGEVTGVIDWSEVAVGDPAIDVAGLCHWGGTELAAAVLGHYQPRPDDGLLARAGYLGACRGVGDIVFGLETGRAEYLQAGARALELCIEGVRSRLTLLT